MASAKVLRQLRINLDAAGIAALRACLSAIAPGVPAKAVQALSFQFSLEEGVKKPIAVVVYEANIDLQALKDLMTAKEPAQLIDIDP